MVMPVQMTRAILFDLVGVLLFPRENYAPDETVDAVDSLIGRATNDTRLRAEILQRFRLNSMEFDHLIAQVADKYTPFPTIWELLPGLRQRYRLGVINNGTYLTFPAFDARYGLGQNFDLFLSSGREGVCKPDARIYRLACERLGVLPNQCLFMDDSTENLSTANRIGMQTIRWPDQQVGLHRFKKWMESETG